MKNENKSISTADLYKKFSTKSSNADDIFEYAIKERQKELEKLTKENLYKNGINKKYLENDNIRIRNTISFLMNSDDNFEFYINSKPLSKGCDDALKYRLNPLKVLKKDSKDIFGVDQKHETKSIVMEKESNLLFFNAWQ